jgi:Phosphotransferase enzyme family
VAASNYVGQITAEGQAAAVTLMRRLGLPADKPAVLSSRGNLIVHFPAAGTVARVATLTAWQRLRPELWLAREVALAGYVAARGGPVGATAHRADPGPHWQDGFVISLWEHVPPRPVRPSPAEAGAVLARFHRTAAAFPGELGDLSPAREHVTDGLTVLERESVIDPATIAALSVEHARALAALDETGTAAPPIVLHGDAHPGNLLAAPEASRTKGDGGGWVWTDLEETARGPAAWDLAVLTDFYGPDDPRAAGGPPQPAVIARLGAPPSSPLRSAGAGIGVGVEPPPLPFFCGSWARRSASAGHISTACRASFSSQVGTGMFMITG